MIAERLSLRDELKSCERQGKRVDGLTTNSDEVQARAVTMMLPLSEYQEKEGVIGKLLVQNNAKSKPPGSWWAAYGKGLPSLLSMARTVLGQPVCASAAGGWLNSLPV